MFTNDLRIPVQVLLTRVGGRAGVDRREYGSGLPTESLSAPWTPSDWRSFVDRRGYVLDLRDPLRATCTDGFGARWVIRCVPSASGAMLVAWASGVSGWAAEYLAA